MITEDGCDIYGRELLVHVSNGDLVEPEHDANII
jgi:hypothetical protein